MTTEARKTTKARRYRKRRRAEQEAETRERIAAATVRLHETVGPAKTTVSAVAREAGVQRATVYRHFPDAEALFDACTAHYWARHPQPDLAAWAEVRDPHERLHRGLHEIYAFYGEVEPMIESTGRDRGRVKGMERAVAAFTAYQAAAVETLLRGRPERGRARDRVRAAISHALAFPTWQSLIRVQGVDWDEAEGLMVALVEVAGGVRA
jgi:AcrR family transcriptional regulator